jgi:hypothetical protein
LVDTVRQSEAQKGVTGVLTKKEKKLILKEATSFDAGSWGKIIDGKVHL